MVARNRQAASVSWPLGWRPLALKGLLASAVLLPLSVLAQAPSPAPAAPEAAGPYKELTPVASLAAATPDARKNLNKYKGEIRAMLAGERSLSDPANQTIFRGFYTRYQIPLMTQLSRLKDIAEERKTLIRDIEYSARSPEAHAALIALVLNEMKSIVEDNYHPAVRYNAMLVISSLNDVEPVRIGGNPTLPVPMVRALPIILAEFKRPENSDAVKLAALLGLAWHLEWENYKAEGAPTMEAGLRAEILKELVALAEAKDAPEGRTPEGHLWLRRRAVEALGLATVKKADASIAAKLDKLLRDEAEPVSLRCAVAAALGKTSLQGLAVDIPATAKDLGYLAMVICDSELTRVDNLKKIEQDRKAKLVSQGGYGSDADSYGGEDMYGSGGYPSDSGGYMPSGGGASGATGPRGPRPSAGAAGGYGDEMYGSGYGSGMPGSMGSGAVRPLDPKAYRFDYVRRRMRAQLYCVQLGLTGGEDYDPSKAPPPGAAAPAFKTGLAAVAKAGDKPTIDKIYGSVRKLISTIETADPDVADMAKLDENLRKEMRTLEGLTRKLNAAPVVAPAATSDAPAGDLPTIPGPPAVPAAGGGAGPGKAAPSKSAPGKAPPGKAAPPAAPSPMPPANAAAAR